MAKKCPKCECPAGEKWAVPFADFLSLLLALFIALYALASVNLEKQKASTAKTHLEKHVGFSITSTEGKEYLLDMECALAFALENRKRMIDTIVFLLGNPKELLFINRNHNHAEIKEEFVIHRKGFGCTNIGEFISLCYNINPFTQ